jgi:two-component system, cell cycle response regulator DivK
MINLLLIEDDPALRAALALTLESAGYGVTAAEDGERGLELATAILPDVILMDIMLPQMNGWEARESLAANPSTAEIPVIGVSALGDPETLERARRLRFAGYLVKPIRLNDVTEAIDRALSRAPT